MTDEIIPAADLPVVSPGATDYVVGTQLGNARRFLISSLASIISASLTFLQSGVGTITRTFQNKGEDLPSVTDWMTSAQRTDAKLTTPLLDHTAAIQAAVTARQGKALFFPDGNYKNTATPTGIDGVHCYGSPRVKFTGTKIPIFSGVFTGNAETAIVGGVIRYYSSGVSGAGWYFIADKSPDHNPILLGPITATGLSSVILEVNFSDFGLDYTEWEPAGFVVGCDETLSQSGLVFGASVGADTIQIKGAYGDIQSSQIWYDAATSTWKKSSHASYTMAWSSGASAKLTVTRTAAAIRQCYSTGSVIPMVVPKRGPSDPLIHVVLDAVTATTFEVRFYNAAGTQILTESADLNFYVMDPVMLPKSFPFNVAPAASTANIWMVGTFRRNPSTY